MSVVAVEKNADLFDTMQALGQSAKAASAVLANAKPTDKNQAIRAAAEIVRSRKEEIIIANDKDMAAAEARGLSPAMLDRLKLTGDRVMAMAQSMMDIADFPDPVGKELSSWDRPNGLKITKVSVPLGVIGIIYEARPNVTADAGALCLKSGNAAILRGGSDSFHSSGLILECLQSGLRISGLPAEAVQRVPTTDREAVGMLLRMSDYVDVIVPRGGRGLIERIQSEAKMPVFSHLDGLCHTYVHSSADLDMAKEIIVNAKMRRTGICGATETLLVDRAVAGALLSDTIKALQGRGCEVRGDEACREFVATVAPTTDEDWDTEYLDAIISVKVVEDLGQAIDHVNTHGSHHTEAVIAEDLVAAAEFMNRVDAGIVMHNTSTQFADGGEFGMGAEIGISTGKMHARGPVGAAELTSYKYKVQGTGQVRP
ncbi:glutamate-5-semialdehyde dehydrogenase [Alphaproteobacteria bacterium]|jgi:glutamate-5-semialdehyde dehydrogenase|nr:glutamate-5-semialdehyde dehydrogenase [Alphaproteobacteria bacterium]